MEWMLFGLFIAICVGFIAVTRSVEKLRHTLIELSNKQQSP